MVKVANARWAPVSRIPLGGLTGERLHKYHTMIQHTEPSHTQHLDLGKLDVALVLRLSLFSDRGKCYFVGQYDANTSMSQILNLNGYMNDIDTSNVSFNLSAWVGGWQGQDDTAVLSIGFLGSNYQIAGNRTSTDPVLDQQRGGITALVFRQKTGIVPVSARFINITVTMTATHGPWNDGSADDICVALKHL